MFFEKFVVIDPDLRRRTSINAVLRESAYTVPVDRVVEIGSFDPIGACLVVSDYGNAAIEIAQSACDAGIHCPIVAYRDTPDWLRVSTCLNNGISAYFKWPSSDREMLETLKWVSSQAESMVRQKSSRANARSRLSTLTPRELQVARGISSGLSSKELAEPLGVSFRTVELHRANIMMKLGARNFATVVRTVVEAEPLSSTEEFSSRKLG